MYHYTTCYIDQDEITVSIGFDTLRYALIIQQSAEYENGFISWIVNNWGPGNVLVRSKE